MADIRDQKIAALERVIVTFSITEQSVRNADLAAKTLADLLDPTMNEVEQDAVWLLLRYAKRKKAEATQKLAAASANLPETNQ